MTFASGLDQNTGNAVEGEALTVNVTDADNGADLGTVTYAWFDNGELVAGDNSNSYTPTATDLDNNSSIDVVVGFTDPTTGNIDQVTLLTAGTEAPPNSGPSTDTFTGAAIGDPSNWFDAGNWSIEIPTANDQVVISATIATAADGTAAAGSLAVNSNATLDVQDGSLSVSGTLQNTATITLESDVSGINASLYFGGDVTNNGSITVSGDAIPNATSANSESVTFEGSVTNSGSITIDAEVHGDRGAPPDEASALFVGTVTNTGTITVGAGTTAHVASATFESTVVNTGGQIIVNTGAAVMLDSATVEGGTITSTDTITAVGPVVIESDALVSGGTLNVASMATLEIEAGTGSGATFDNVNVQLEGSESGNLQIDGGATLTTEDTTTIQGSGTVVNDGTLQAISGELSVQNTVNNSDGAVVASGGFIDFDLGITGGTATISNGGKIEYGWSSTAQTAFAGAGTLVLDHQVSTDANAYTLAISGFDSGDTIDVKDLAYAAGETVSWTQAVTGADAYGTLTITSDGQTASVTLDGTYSQGNFALASDGSTANGGNPGTDIVGVQSPYLWGSITSPAQTTTGVHLYGSFSSVPFGPSNGALVGAQYGVTSSGYSDAGPDNVTTNLLTLDPFLLPYQSSITANGATTGEKVATTTITDFPHNSRQLLLPSASNTQTDGIGFYLSEDGSGNATINEFTFDENTTGLNGSTAPTITNVGAVESNLIGADLQYFASFENGSTGFFTGGGSAYGLGWAQYNATAATLDGVAPDTYQINFQIFPTSVGTSNSPVETIATFSNVTSLTDEPAWFFHSAGSVAIGGGRGIFASAVAESNGTANADIQFQAYSESGTTSISGTALPSFVVAPNLTYYTNLYGLGVTDAITQQPASSTHTYSANSLMFALDTGGSNYSFAWDDTVTAAGNTYHQVEFAIYTQSGSLVSPISTFQVADAQNVELQQATIDGASVEILAYGDNTGTHVVEFDTSGHEIAALFDPSTTTFGQLGSFGDGRISLSYDNVLADGVTTQYTTDIYDLRTSGLNINDTAVTLTSDQYIAGTQYGDNVVIGASSVKSTYYYVGDNTTGPAPTDHFTGATGASSWNVAILPDAPSDYTISTDNGVTTLVNIGDPAHAGTLVLTDVQAIAFEPAVDPSGNSGTLTATGAELLVLGPLPGGGEPITIDNSSTLGLATADSGNVIFAGVTGQFVDTDPSTFTGIVSGISGSGDVLDLQGLSSQSTDQFLITPTVTGNNTTLTVTDEANGHSASVTVAGTGASWTASYDGNGGVDVAQRSPYLWDSITSPSTPTAGVHLYGASSTSPFGVTNGALIGVVYGATTSGYMQSGPDAITSYLLTLDPFLLPYQSNQTVNGATGEAVSTTTYDAGDFPHNSRQLLLASTSATNTEGIGFFITESGSTATINQYYFNEGTSGLNSSTPVVLSTPVAVETGLIATDLQYFASFETNSSNLFTGTANGAAYSLAWAQYNSSTDTYAADFQLFSTTAVTASNPDADALTGQIQILSASAASFEEAPAWYFRSAGSFDSKAIFAAAFAQESNGSDVIEFQAYSESGTTTITVTGVGTVNLPSFTITPNLSAFGANAADLISQQAPSTDHTYSPNSLVFTLNAGGSTSGYSFAWDDTVTAGGQTFYQVEFALTTSTGSLVSQSEFQVSDAQSVAVATTVIDGSDVELLAYGDNTGTHVVEFNSSGVEIASLFDPSTTTFGGLGLFGDGRIALTYDNVLADGVTTQYTTDIYDLRTSGLSVNDTGTTLTSDQYFAGTQYGDDIVVGASRVNSTYYYVGDTTTGPAPTDHFTGATGASSWNVAILPDAPSNYAITTTSGMTTLVDTGDPTHAGTLELTDVQALAFAPTVDPSGNTGTLTATGDELYILGPLPGGAEPITIDSGSTLALATAEAGGVTFAGATGSLVLDQPSSFSGEISGPSSTIPLDASDIINLKGFATTDTASTAGGFELRHRHYDADGIQFVERCSGDLYSGRRLCEFVLVGHGRQQ